MITLNAPIIVGGQSVTHVTLSGVFDAEDQRRCIAHFVGAHRGLVLWAGDDYPVNWTAEDRYARVQELAALIPQCFEVSSDKKPVDYRQP